MAVQWMTAFDLLTRIKEVVPEATLQQVKDLLAQVDKAQIEQSVRQRVRAEVWQRGEPINGVDPVPSYPILQESDQHLAIKVIENGRVLIFQPNDPRTGQPITAQNAEEVRVLLEEERISHLANEELFRQVVALL